MFNAVVRVKSEHTYSTYSRLPFGPWQRTRGANAKVPEPLVSVGDIFCTLFRPQSSEYSHFCVYAQNELLDTAA